MNNNWSINELQEIWMLVSELHNNQKYGGVKEGQEVEYINHIGSVTFEILKAVEIDHALSANLAIKCAMLHDTIEDTSFTYEGVVEVFGTEVANGVMALTKNELLESKVEQMTDSLKRIKEQPKEVWAVKMADRICNLYAPPFYWDHNKILNYQKEAQIIYNELKGGSDYLANRLKNKIDAYSKYLKS